MPKCCRCLLDKDETEFYRTFYHCKACCKLDYARKREAKHAYYERNKEHITQRTKAYRKRWNQTDNGREANKRNGHLWRARKFNNGRVEPITLTELYIRDRGICGICKSDCNASDASIDHIIPLSKHGTHTWDNVQLAHLTCNKRKGNKLLADLNLPLDAQIESTI